MSHVPPPMPWVLRARGSLRAIVHWLAALAIMLLALRPLWTIPLQGDDFLAFLTINSRDDIGFVSNAFGVFKYAVNVSDVHFNPLGYFFEALLKGGMLATTSSVITASVLHHGTIAVLMLSAVPLSAMLVSRLLRVFAGVAVTPSALAVPVAVGFAVTAQITAEWSTYDPLVVHPIFGALPTVLGIAYLSASVGALEVGARKWRVAVASLLGVVSFLVYESVIVFVAVVVLVAWMGRRRGLVSLPGRLLGVTLPPLATFVFGRLFAMSHPSTGYAGASFRLDLSTLPTWSVATVTSQPGALWGIASRYVDLGKVVPYALVSAVLVGAALLGWSFWQRQPSAVVGGGATSTWQDDATKALRALAPIVALGLLAPLPYVVSGLWSQTLVVLGSTYMHSLTVLWCWAMAFAVVVARLALRRPSWRVLLVVVLTVTVWLGVQFSVNRQLGALLAEHPFMGIDVMKALDDTTTDEASRCDSVALMRPHPAWPDWISVLNREYERRHGEPFCSSAGHKG